MMRIITGKARGIKLATLEGDNTRPPSERAKEAVFSMLQFEIEGRRVLDLFAGSGQMGLEAMSRGAEFVMFVDAAPDAVAVVKENAKKCNFFEDCRYLISDYRNYLRKAAGRDSFHLVFLDPPYALHCASDVLHRLLDGEFLAAGCVVVVESEEEDVFAGDAALASRFSVRKATRYGRTWIHILDVAEEA